MKVSKRSLVVAEPLAEGVTAARFTRPDNRAHLDAADTEETALYRDLCEVALDGLAEGQAVVLNFGLVNRFPTAFYRLMLKVRETVLGRKARLLVCGFSAEIMEGLRLFRGEKLFEITVNEDQALHKVRAPA